MYDPMNDDADFIGEDTGLRLDGTFTVDEPIQNVSADDDMPYLELDVVSTEQPACVAASVTPEKRRHAFNGNQYSNKDKYDRAIDYFVENPNELHASFMLPSLSEHGCLFDFVTHGRTDDCIFQIAVFGNGPNEQFTDNLKKMYKDGLLIDPSDIAKLPKRKRRKYLVVYANAQRAADLCFRPL